MAKRKLLEKGYGVYSKIAYNLPRGYSPLPPLIIWLITYKCNLRCKMCTFYGEGGKLPDIKQELSFEEIKKVIDDLKKSYRTMPYKPYIGFMGGEPFIHPHIFGIFQYLKDNGFKYAVTTNLALLNDEKIEKLLEIGVNDLRISLDGPEKVHDKIRNIPGTFNKVMTNLRKIQKDPRGKKIPVRFNSVICPDNIEHLEKMVDIAKEFNAHMSFQHLMFIDEPHAIANKNITKNMLGEELHMDATTMLLTKEQVEKAKQSIKAMLEKAKQMKVKVSFTPDLKIEEFDDYYFNLFGWTHSKKCMWPWGTARITPIGDVYSCMYYMFGNLKENSFKKIWNNEKARKFRTALKKVKLFPGCIRCCKI